MKIFVALALMLGAVEAAGADPVATGPFVAAEPFLVPGVFQAHDRWPGGVRGFGRDKQTTGDDSECNEEHNLQPDGDHDCDDPKSGVPEPGALGSTLLLGLGVVGVYLSGRRRRG